MREEKAAVNTDKEIWRETPGDYYSPSIHVTEKSRFTKKIGIGINVGGHVYVKPVEEWHRLAERDKATTDLIRWMRDTLESNLTLLKKHAENTTFSVTSIYQANVWLEENGDYCKCDKQKEGCGADRWAVNSHCNTCGKEVGDEQ